MSHHFSQSIFMHHSFILSYPKTMLDNRYMFTFFDRADRSLKISQHEGQYTTSWYRWWSTIVQLAAIQIMMNYIVLPMTSVTGLYVLVLFFLIVSGTKIISSSLIPNHLIVFNISLNLTWFLYLIPLIVNLDQKIH